MCCCGVALGDVPAFLFSRVISLSMSAPLLPGRFLQSSLFASMANTRIVLLPLTGMRRCQT